MTSRRVFLGSAVAVGVGAAAAGNLSRPRPASAGTDATVVADGLAIIDCAAWGARAPRQPVPVLPHRPNKIIIHHTATANSPDTSRAHAIALARDIQDLHMDRNGWRDTGQHFTISRGGYVLEGRHGSLAYLRGGVRMVRGTHCVGQNDQSIGIENEGTYLTVQPTAALWQALVVLCGYTCRRYRIPATEIYGHNDFNATLCPGLLHARLPLLRRMVATMLA